MAASGASGPRAPEPRRIGPGAGAALAALAVFLVLALWRARAPTLWNDEVMSISFARRSWYGLLHGAASDRVHPPLFYALLKVWIGAGGEGALWLRLLPIATAALTIPVAGRLCRELGLSRRVSALALLLIVTSGYVVYYAQELRPYALLLLASTLSLLAFVRAVAPDARGGRPWILLALANTLLVYAHYFGWLVVGTEALWVLGRERRRTAPFAASCAIPVAAFAPWVWVVSRELSRGRGLSGNLAGLATPGVLALPRFYGGLVGPYRAGATAPQLWVGVALTASAILAASRRGGEMLVAETPRASAALLAAFAFVPPVAALLVSVAIRPVFHPRYLVEATVPFLLLSAAAVSALEPKPARLAWAGAVAAWCAWGAADQLVRPSRIAWGDLVAGMERGACSAVPAGAPIYALGEAAPRPVAYYLDRAGSRAPVIPVASVDAVGPGAGWLAFHAGSELEGAPYWSAARPDAVRASLEARGLRVLCEEAAGTERRRGMAVAFVPAGANP